MSTNAKTTAKHGILKSEDLRTFEISRGLEVIEVSKLRMVALAEYKPNDKNAPKDL